MFILGVLDGKKRMGGWVGGCMDGWMGGRKSRLYYVAFIYCVVSLPAADNQELFSGRMDEYLFCVGNYISFVCSTIL